MYSRQDEDIIMDPRPTPENLPQSYASHTQEITTEEKELQLYPISKERWSLITGQTEPQILPKQERQQSPLPMPKQLSPSLGISCNDIMPKKTDKVTFSALCVLYLRSGKKEEIVPWEERPL